MEDLLKIISFLGFAFFTIASAVLVFLGKHFGEKHSGVKDWFEHFWMLLRSTNYSSLSVNLIKKAFFIGSSFKVSQHLYYFSTICGTVVGFPLGYLYFTGWFQFGIYEIDIPVLLLFSLLSFVVMRHETQEGSRERLLSIMIPLFFSGFLTYLSLWLGSTFLSIHEDFHELKLLFGAVNLVFDGLTVFVTLFILKKILEYPKKLFALIIVDILLASVFACCSLYFSLVAISEISFWDTPAYLVFAGKDENLQGFSLYMHTALVPTALYLGAIGIAWMAKFLIYPVDFFLKSAKDRDEPLEYTATLFGVFAAIFLVARLYFTF